MSDEQPTVPLEPAEDEAPFGRTPTGAPRVQRKRSVRKTAPKTAKSTAADQAGGGSNRKISGPAAKVAETAEGFVMMASALAAPFKPVWSLVLQAHAKQLGRDLAAVAAEYPAVARFFESFSASGALIGLAGTLTSMGAMILAEEGKLRGTPFEPMMLAKVAELKQSAGLPPDQPSPAPSGADPADSPAPAWAQP